MRPIILTLFLLFAASLVATAQPELKFMDLRIGMTYTQFWKVVRETPWTYGDQSDSADPADDVFILSLSNHQRSFTPISCIANDSDRCPIVALGTVVFSRGKVYYLEFDYWPYSYKELPHIKDLMNKTMKYLQSVFGSPHTLTIAPSSMTMDALLSIEEGTSQLVATWKWGTKRWVAFKLIRYGTEEFHLKVEMVDHSFLRK